VATLGLISRFNASPRFVAPGCQDPRNSSPTARPARSSGVRPGYMAREPRHGLGFWTMAGTIKTLSPPATFVPVCARRAVRYMSGGRTSLRAERVHFLSDFSEADFISRGRFQGLKAWHYSRRRVRPRAKTGDFFPPSPSSLVGRSQFVDRQETGKKPGIRENLFGYRGFRLGTVARVPSGRSHDCRRQTRSQCGPYCDLQQLEEGPARWQSMSSPRLGFSGDDAFLLVERRPGGLRQRG